MENVIGAGPSTVIHDQDIANNESRLVAEIGVAKWLAFGVVIPLRVFDTSIRYLDMSGQAVDIENPFIHHNNQTLIGLGDPWLLGRFARKLGDFTVGARLGVALPVGRIEEDPFELGDMGLAHEHSQFGAGIVQPLFGFDVSRSFGKLRTELYALSIQSLYENRNGYRAGDRYAAGLGAARPLGDSWRVRATFEMQAETAERWNGVVQTEEGNTGRIDLLAGIEATYRVTDTWFLAAQAKLPVYTHVVGGQLDPSLFVGLTVGTTFQLFGGEEDHAHGDDHDHGDEHGHDDHAKADWTGLDMQAVDGARDLVPVPDKITVFDFWATWCKPCVVLDGELAELARKHPSIAVRKVDVADVDSPAYKKHLRDAVIPHVKVFGRDGKLLLELSGDPHELAEAIEKLVK
ncbi:MAG: thioredoxin family protein [Deltaproteobacteria bacterium]|nr:thioredoxin family protein [Deltaproteobacteria bacterium]